MQQSTLPLNVSCARPSTFSELYEYHVHGYASLLICTVGAVSQLLNFIIFTRRDMAIPKKALLAGLAVTDLAISLSYIPVTWYMFFHLDYFSHRERISYSWAVILILHFYVSQVLLMISVWLMMTLAVFRYVAIFNPLRYMYWCEVITVRRIVIVGCIVCALQRLPFLYSCFVLHSEKKIIEQFRSCENKNVPMGTNIGLLLLRMNIKERWLYVYNFFGCSVLFNLLPSIILVAISFRLLYELKRSRKTDPTLILGSTKNGKKMNHRHRRTTRILLVTLFMFLLTEIPQGILILIPYLSSNGRKFYEDYYSRLANLNDLIVVTTSSFNFVVYYMMYSRFHMVLKSLLMCKKERFLSESGTK